MKLAIYLIIILAALSCNHESSDDGPPESNTSNEPNELGLEKDLIKNIESNKKMEPPFYMINTAAVKSESVAIEQVRVLEKDAYKADYLWIPDYASLSGAEYFSVFIGPYKTREECAIVLDKYHAIHPKAYGTLVSHNSKREVVNGLEDAVQ